MDPLSPHPTPGYYGMPGPPTPGGLPLRRTSGFAVASLVSSVVGLVTCCALAPSILGVTFGAIALGPIRREEQRGRGLAVSGIILGALGLLMGVGLLAVVVRAPDPDPIPGEQITAAQRATLEALHVVQPGELIELFYAEGMFSLKEGGVVITGARLVRYTGDGAIESRPLEEVAAVAFTPATSFFDEADFVVEFDDGDLMLFGVFSSGGETFNRVLKQRVTAVRADAGKPAPRAELSSFDEDG
ncbi:MAG: DUF4190 domain-containing protein [Planctomycetota bacterium]